MKKNGNTRVLISNAQTAADIRYETGVEPPENTLFIQKGTRRTLVVSRMEANRMRRLVSPGICVATPEQINAEKNGGPDSWIHALVPRGVVSIPFSFPAGMAERLREKGYDLKIDPPPAHRKREIKRDAEIQSIRLAQRAAAEAVKCAIHSIASAPIGKKGLLRKGRGPLTSETVRAVILARLAEKGFRAPDTIVACGAASSDPHERGHGPLRAGEPIVIDVFPQSELNGYWGDITRTVCRGPAPAALKKQYHAVKAAQAAQLKMLKAGVRADAVHRAGAGLMTARGFITQTVDGRPQGFIHGTGHGVGLEIHEAPGISPANRKTLRAGHVVTIEPGLYYPETGGVRIEDTVLITQDGFKMLAPCQKRLEV